MTKDQIKKKKNNKKIYLWTMKNNVFETAILQFKNFDKMSMDYVLWSMDWNTTYAQPCSVNKYI